MESGARFSPCGTWRYRLWREWDTSKPTMAWLMLNPSIANEERLDPTVTRCLKRAQAMGFGRLEILNLFSLVSTDPKGLYTCADPVGPENDTAILTVAKNAGMLVCAWSNHARHLGREAEVLEKLERIPKYVLGLNKNGTPKHPLYISNSILPILWELP